MSLNLTAVWLDARLSPSMLHFSGTVGSSNTYLKGPGGASGDGFPMTSGGVIRSLSVWDGTTLHTAALDVTFNAGDRIALGAFYDPTPQTFAVTVLRNFISMPLVVSGLPINSTYFATVELLLKEDA